MENRVIKFRVWDKHKKVFIPEDVYAILNKTSFGAFGQMITDWEDYRDGEYFYDNAQELIFYTGLTDKHCVEVYEGDIVKCSIGCPHIVEFLFEVPNNNLGGGGMPGFYLSGLNQGYSWTGDEEVIGNVFEHPELIK